MQIIKDVNFKVKGLYAKWMDTIWEPQFRFGIPFRNKYIFFNALDEYNPSFFAMCKNIVKDSNTNHPKQTSYPKQINELLLDFVDHDEKSLKQVKDAWIKHEDNFTKRFTSIHSKHKIVQLGWIPVWDYNKRKVVPFEITIGAPPSMYTLFKFAQITGIKRFLAWCERPEVNIKTDYFIEGYYLRYLQACYAHSLVIPGHGDIITYKTAKDLAESEYDIFLYILFIDGFTDGHKFSGDCREWRVPSTIPVLKRYFNLWEDWHIFSKKKPPKKYRKFKIPTTTCYWIHPGHADAGNTTGVTSWESSEATVKFWLMPILDPILRFMFTWEKKDNCEEFTRRVPYPYEYRAALPDMEINFCQKSRYIDPIAKFIFYRSMANSPARNFMRGGVWYDEALKNCSSLYEYLDVIE